MVSEDNSDQERYKEEINFESKNFFLIVIIIITEQKEYRIKIWMVKEE